MEIILLKDIKGVGKKDEIIKASDGHARNYLLPKGLGIEATKENVIKLTKKHEKEDAVKAENLQEAKELGEKIEKTVIVLNVKAGESGKLFGTITNKEIAEELEKIGITIDKKKIALKNHIKNAGEFRVDVKLHPKVTVEMNVIVKGI